MGPKECKAPDRYDPAEVGRLSASAARIRMDTVSGGIAAPEGQPTFSKEKVHVNPFESGLTWEPDRKGNFEVSSRSK